MAEQLSRAEQVKDPAREDYLDRAGPDDPQVLDRAVALREDRRSCREELDLGRVRDALDLGLLQGVERGMRAQERDDVSQRGRMARRALPIESVD